MKPIIKPYLWNGAKVVLLAEAASRYIEETGEQGAAHTTHWENRAVLNERGTPGMGSYALAADDGRLITSAGMAATFDLTLSLIGSHVSAAAVTTVSDILLHENIRALSSLQPFGGKVLSLTGNKALDQCIELMQANMDEPLRISELVDLLGISERSLERHFRAHFDTSPQCLLSRIASQPRQHFVAQHPHERARCGAGLWLCQWLFVDFQSSFWCDPYRVAKTRGGNAPDISIFRQNWRESDASGQIAWQSHPRDKRARGRA